MSTDNLDSLKYQKERLTEKLRAINAGEKLFVSETKKAETIKVTGIYLKEVEAAIKAATKEAK